MPKVTQRYLDQRRQQILDAALGLFARNGFCNTKIADIARAAGVSHGAIYRYFPSKDDIVDAAAVRDRRARDRRFAEAERAGEPIDMLDELLAGYISRYWSAERVERAQLRMQLFADGVHNQRTNRTIRENRGDVFARMAEVVRRGQARGQINRALDPLAVARLLAAMYDGLMAQQSAEPELDIGACLPVISALLRGDFVTPYADQEVPDGRQPALRPPAA
jgi:AcrR family transcriptional regulator